MVTHDSGKYNALKNAYIQLYHDGVKNQSSIRTVPFCLVNPGVSSLAKYSDSNVRFSAQRQRAYSGHVLIENPAAGKHSTGLRIHSEADQTRVRVRGFRVIAFK